MSGAVRRSGSETIGQWPVGSSRSRAPGQLGEEGMTFVDHLRTCASGKMQLGWPFTIVRPDELRQAVAKHASLLAGYAERRISDT